MTTTMTSRPDQAYHLITGEELDDVVQRLIASSRPSAVDTETWGVTPGEENATRKGWLLLISFYNPQVSHFPYVVDYEKNPSDLDRLKPWLESPRPKILANAAYDCHIFANHGVKLQGIWWDTTLADTVYNTARLGRHGLKDCVHDHLRYKMVDLIKEEGNTVCLYETRYDEFVRYSGEDALMTYALAAHQWKKLLGTPWGKFTSDQLVTDYLMPFSNVLWRMQRRGIHVNVEYLQGIITRMDEEMIQTESKIYTLAGGVFNLNSPDQVAKVLYEKLQLKAPKGGKPRKSEAKICTLCGGKKINKRTKYLCPIHGDQGLIDPPATSKDAIEKIKHPIAKLITGRRNTSKLRDYCQEYIDHRRADGRVHANLKILGAQTGRLSCSKPNLQNVPAREKVWGIRGAFDAEPGNVLICVDQSQLEYRIMAHFSNDPKLIKYICDGHDIHAAVAHKLFRLDCTIEEVEAKYPDKRKSGKNLNFGILYGMGVPALAANLSIPQKEAAQLLAEYFDEYPHLKRAIEAAKDECRAWGYVKTIIQRKRHLPGIHSLNPKIVAYAERQAVNAKIQGCKAADSYVLSEDGFMTIAALREKHPKIYTGGGGLTDEYTVHHTGHKLCYQVETSHGFDTVTADHRFMVYGDGDCQIRQLKDLKEGDFILFQETSATGGTQPEGATEGVAEIIGALCGNGNYGRDRDFRLAYGNHHEYGRQMRELIQKELHCYTALRKSKGSLGESYYVDVSSTPARQRLLALGLDPESGVNKCVPEWILTSEPRVRAACLRGLYDTDGGLVAHTPKFGNTSWNLTLSFYLLCHSLGVPCFISQDKTRTKTDKISWRVTVRHEYAQKFFELVKPRMEHKTRTHYEPAKLFMPPEVVKDVAYYVQYHPRWANNHIRSETAHIIRMRNGSGTQAACRKFLDRVGIDSGEGEFLADLVQLPWAKIWSITPVGVQETLDIEIHSDEHTYIGQGLLEHNSASDILMLSMIKIERDKELKARRCRMLLQVHDELLFEVPKEEAEACLPIIQHLMENPMKAPMRVPLKAEPFIGLTWKEAKH